jgi:uncharacterized membrane protein YkvA (DUF1232 family)
MRMKMSDKDNAKDYSEDGFFNKCKKYAFAIGEECLEKAFTLYYATESENCTLAHKTAIYGALAYLVSPIDAIPDLTPILDYTDDMGVIALALTSVATCIDKKVKGKAKNKVADLFS